ncbi:endolytic transglycosylase MltG [Candidatus Wolfebacteria bacterium]|nr:endolytic transglycosylase MltG [Candidatus Wolfebacteria bacterium]
MKIFSLKSAIIGLLIIIFLTTFFIKNILSISKAGETSVIINIPAGAGINEIAETVYSAKLIRSKAVFKIYAVLSGKAHLLKSGGYEIQPPVSISALLKILTEGPKEIAVVVFPGMTVKEIDDRLAGAGVIKSGDLANFDNGFLEGYLMPDTYYFYRDSGVNFVVEKILGNFKNKISVLAGDKIGDLRFFRENDKLKKILIIASILEKEIPDNEEREIAAGILEKRLKSKIPLQIDATIVYLKCGGRFLNCAPLQKSDYKIDSPYNTYLYQGLPPAPISNPSSEAISAAMEWRNSSYWYYLSDLKTKKTIFSKTLEEHNRNRKKYLGS